MTDSSKPTPEIDKDQHYGWWRETQKWKDRLSRKMAHKSLDIPDDDMNITNTTNKTGVGIGGLLGVAAMAGIPGIGVALYALHMLNQAKPPEAPPVQTPVVVAPPVQPGPADSDYVVRFWDKDGNPIDVPHLNEKPKED